MENDTYKIVSLILEDVRKIIKQEKLANERVYCVGHLLEIYAMERLVEYLEDKYIKGEGVQLQFHWHFEKTG